LACTLVKKWAHFMWIRIQHKNKNNLCPDSVAFNGRLLRKKPNHL
jgi:hypothetical protein